MTETMHPVDQVAALIQQGQSLLLAGDEQVLRQLPPGNWIGGTIPYFVGQAGGVFSRNQVCITRLPDYVVRVAITTYDETTIHQVYRDAPPNGFSVIIIPAHSNIHFSFALKCHNYPGFATRPLAGWVSGISLDASESAVPLVFDGATATAHPNKAVVMHVELPPHKIADVQIINFFQPGQGDTLTFTQDGFSAREVLVNGQPAVFVDYLARNRIDTRLPLLADMHGAMINTSFKAVNRAEQRVDFYAPVFAGVEYKIARPIANYLENFEAQLPHETGDRIFFACNCVLNFIYADLQNKEMAGITGPMTFGEIAYQLLNQTLAYVTIENLKQDN